MKEFNYTIEELNLAVYQVRTAEETWQKAKDEYEILHDTSKDLLARFKNSFSVGTDLSEAKAETLARSSKDWTHVKDGIYAAQRKLGEASIAFNHAKRVLDALTSGLAYKRELLKRGIVEQ